MVCTLGIHPMIIIIGDQNQIQVLVRMVLVVTRYNGLFHSNVENLRVIMVSILTNHDRAVLKQEILLHVQDVPL